MDMFVFAAIAAILFVPFAFLLYQAFHRVNCPDCGESLPAFISPFQKTRRMWRAGGYLCTNCGCETNMAGQKITPDTPPAPFPTLQFALLVVLLVIGVGLGTFSLVAKAAPSPRDRGPAGRRASPTGTHRGTDQLTTASGRWNEMANGTGHVH